MEHSVRLRSAVRVAMGIVVFLASSRLVAHWAKESHTATRSVVGARSNVSRELPPPSSTAAAAPSCPTVLLLGSSQASVVTAMEPGGERIDDAVGTTIDALADQWADPKVCFHRIAVNGFLPGEMLPVAAYEVDRPTHPKVIIAPIIWESLAHDEYFRPPARTLLVDPAFAGRFLHRLRESGAPPDLADEYASTAAIVQREHAQLEAMPPGERVDAAFAARLTPHFRLIGNLDAQVTLRRGTFEKALGLLTHGGTTNVHEIVPARLERNIERLIAIADYLRGENVAFVAYRVPERTDVAPLTSRVGQEEVMERLRHELELRGASVLDLHDAVPNELWGWVGDSPDRTHFVIRGHQLVASALIREGKRSGAFRFLEGAP